MPAHNNSNGIPSLSWKRLELVSIIFEYVPHYGCRLINNKLTPALAQVLIDQYLTANWGGLPMVAFINDHFQLTAAEARERAKAVLGRDVPSRDTFQMDEIDQPDLAYKSFN